MSKVQVLTLSSPNYDHLIPKIHILSRQVFEPGIPEDQYTTIPPKAHQLRLSNWHLRLGEPDAVIFYITSPSKDKILAFFLAYPRPLVEGSQTTVYYIWLAAVHPSARGKGLFPLLLEATKEHARAGGYSILSIGTVPSVFTRMYSILSREGSGWEEVEWKAEDDGTPKVVFKMDL